MEQELKCGKKHNAKPIRFRVIGDCFVCTSHAPTGGDRAGYPELKVDGRRMKMHRHVYEQTVGEIPRGTIVRHTCDNRKCINPDHMILGTHADNAKDRVMRGRSAIGERAGRAKLCANEVAAIYADQKTPHKELAAIHGVSPTTISNIRSGKTWRHTTAAQQRTGGENA